MTELSNSAELMASRLRQVKLLHTAIWVVMVAAIVLVPLAGWLGETRLAVGMTVFILAECLVLGLNHGRCPLTHAAARYTNERTDNFDIYLPLWLARYNKLIFGTLFVAGELFWLWRWIRRSGI